MPTSRTISRHISKHHDEHSSGRNRDSSASPFTYPGLEDSLPQVTPIPAPTNRARHPRPIEGADSSLDSLPSARGNAAANDPQWSSHSTYAMPVSAGRNQVPNPAVCSHPLPEEFLSRIRSQAIPPPWSAGSYGPTPSPPYSSPDLANQPSQYQDGAARTSGERHENPDTHKVTIVGARHHYPGERDGERNTTEK